MNTAASQKIKRLKDLVKIVERLKKEGKKVVLCHGVFDLLHPGHIRHFASAKKHGDILIVSITADKYVKKGPGRPVFNEHLRSEVLSAINYIDFITISNFDSSIEVIKRIKPDFYVKGPDYKNRKNIANVPRKLGDEAEAVKKGGGKIIFTDDILFSSSKLINDYLTVYPAKTHKYLDRLRSKYTSDYIIEKLASFTQLKVMIIGDAIIDQYHYCLPMGKSSKEPVMVHQYNSEESFAGGTLATVNHLASLSKKLTLVTLLGKKRSFKSFIGKRLKPGVNPVFFFKPNNHTIIKRRYVDLLTRQKLFQISYLKEDYIGGKLEREIVKYIKSNIKKYDLVVVNDFGHGLMTKRIIKTICNNAKFLALNVQANSANYGFNIVTKYPKADFICIDEQEIRLATHDKFSELEGLIRKVYKKMKCRQMIITQGGKGSISYSDKEGFYETPALTDKVIDRVGAGDALFAIATPCSYGGMEKELVSFVGNVAGALKVQNVGNKTPIEFGDLARFITRLLK